VADDGLSAWVRDAFAPLGQVSVRRMFGGAGVSIDGLMIALIADGELFLKVDALSKSAFIAEGLGPFVYHKDGKPYAMSYYQAPDIIFDDPEQARHWGALALAAAQRAKR
jgi:DNA transformation protein and related proteins